MNIWKILSRWSYEMAYMDIYGLFCCTLDPCVVMYDLEVLGDITIRVIYWVRKGQFTAMHGYYSGSELTVEGS